MASMEIIFQQAECRLGTALAPQTAKSTPRAALEPPSLPSSLGRGKGTVCICYLLQGLQMKFPVFWSL